MSVELTIPKLGMTMKEAKITQWAKAEGEWVQKGEVILVIETEKITFEVEAPADGYLHILASPGKTLPVGARVGVLLEDREAYEVAAGAGEGPSQPSPPVESPPPPAPGRELAVKASERAECRRIRPLPWRGRQPGTMGSTWGPFREQDREDAS